VARARRNAVLSGLAELPIRWFAEVAAKFVRRVLKRGRRYDAVILDPPAYGHGPHGETWKLTDDLPALVADCLQLAGDELEFLLLSCHTGELAFAAPLLKYLVTTEAELGRRGKLDASDLATVSLDGERLHAGAAVRWTTAAAAPDRASNDTKPAENVRQR
jgi:23S rRNA (cytosine1962-C5)-methyltransferase